MPTYVYECEQGHRFELFHSMSDDSAKLCPECGAAAKRVPAGGAGFLFKGSGFYATDYRSKGYKESAKKEGGGSGDRPASPPAASGGAAESKPTTPEGGGGSTKPEKS
ncbi:MAG TPA: FmdB family zinc ribbon protein [Methylomirabilota bacterium]|jgi:putative FmdB family regulatory protein|nr:FmdB family zinc ribbon protein [Methylomirabilota bacterium]